MMKLKNVKHRKNSFSRGAGLMFQKPSNPNVFHMKKEKIIPLHMLFVFYKLDVLYLDKNKSVVEKTSLKPFTFYTPKNKAMYVVEAPFGYFKNVSLGDKIFF